MPPDDRQTSRGNLLAWLAAAALPLYFCATRLRNELWTDEVYTLTVFASQPLAKIATDYSAPNNHLLYSLGLHFISQVSLAEPWLRAGGLMCAAIALVAVFWTARPAGLAAAVSATLLLGLNQMFLGHVMQLRGYGLSMALAAVLLALALRPTQRASRGRAVAIALSSAALLYTIPTNVLFLAPLTLWVAASTIGTSRRAAIATVAPLLAGWLLAALLYAPIARDVLAASGPPQADRWSGLFATSQAFLVAALRDAPPLALLAYLGVLVICVQRPSKLSETGNVSNSETPWIVRAPRVALPIVSLGIVAGALLLCGVLGLRPFARNFCPLLPALAVSMGVGLADLIGATQSAIEQRFGRVHGPQRAAVLCGLLIVAVLLPAIWNYPARLERYRQQQFAQDGYFNYYDANFHPSRVARAVAEATQAEANQSDTGYRLFLPEEDHFTLAYACYRQGVSLGRDAPRVRIYAVVAPQTDLQKLAAAWGSDGRELRADSGQTTDYGYFRLWRSEAPLPLAVLDQPTENRPETRTE